MKNLIIFLLIITNSIGYAKDIKNTISAGVGIVTVHVISIGIDKYRNNELKYCVSDSKLIIEKIRKNDSNRRGIVTQKVKLIYNIHLLNNHNASISEVKKAFIDIIKKAKSSDYFIFYFGGVISYETGSGDISFNTIETSFVKHRKDLKGTCLSLNELSHFLEQIPCQNQLVISESGFGEFFSETLIKHLFESNSLISANINRNRIIMTTTRYEGHELEEINGGPLVYYLNNLNDNILNVFRDKEAFDFELFKSEINNPLEVNRNKRYTAVYSENDYKKILLNNTSISRGSKGININPEAKTIKNATSQTHALIVATNNYVSSKEWNTLKNPINDANSVAELLENKYNVTVSKQYDKSYNEILKELVRIKESMSENDKFIFFIAGHGYYSDNLSDGFLVLQDSKETNDDFGLNSYLSMATLQRLLDNMPNKNVFAIFDVCFGLSFDPLSKDLTLSNLKDVSKDISLDEFIERKNEKTSRIFLASGRYEVPDYWNTSLNHSPFADKLIKSLQSENEFINPSKIFSALEGNITQPFLKQFGKHDERGDFLLKAK